MAADFPTTPAFASVILLWFSRNIPALVSAGQEPNPIPSPQSYSIVYLNLIVWFITKGYAIYEFDVTSSLQALVCMKAAQPPKALFSMTMTMKMTMKNIYCQSYTDKGINHARSWHNIDDNSRRQAQWYHNFDKGAWSEDLCAPSSYE